MWNVFDSDMFCSKYVEFIFPNPGVRWAAAKACGAQTTFMLSSAYDSVVKGKADVSLIGPCRPL